MPLLLAYLKSVPPGHTHHLAKACYALENFVENLGSDGIWGCEGGDKAVALAEGGKVCNSLNYCLWWGEGCGRTIRMVSLEAGGSPVSMRPGLVGRRLPFLLGPKVQPYLPELMECMLQPLRNTSIPRAKELAVSALGAIGEEKETGGGAQGSPREPLAGGPGIPSSWFCLSYSHGCPGFPSALLPHHHGAPAEIPGDRP